MSRDHKHIVVRVEYGDNVFAWFGAVNKACRRAKAPEVAEEFMKLAKQQADYDAVYDLLCKWFTVE